MRLSTNAGCTAVEATPSQGDVRLVPLRGVPSTAACDDVHLGGVQIFNDGRWGGICFVTSDLDSSFTIDAGVICRQLGFPFGSLMEPGDNNGAPVDYVDYRDPGELVWASDVVCSGLEERLGDCLFPEDFGANPSRGGTDRIPAPSPIGGVIGFRAECGRRDRGLLSVACRRFEIEGAQTRSPFRIPRCHVRRRFHVAVDYIPAAKRIVNSVHARNRGDLVDILCSGINAPPE